MLNRIRSFFKSEVDSNRPGGHEERKSHIAAAAMLIEAAMTDGRVDDAERTRIAALVERRLGVPREDVKSILAESENRAEAAVDIYSFLRVVNDRFDHAERITLVEMLWDVVYADGVLHDHEATLIRRVSGMLGLTDVESGSARKRVLARRDVARNNPDAP